MIARCPNCGASLEYDIITDMMVCAHCGASFMVGDIQTREEKQEKEALMADTSGTYAEPTDEDMGSDDDMMECNIYTCTACGAELMINGVETSTYCAFCSQPTIVFDRVSMNRRPKLIIPFKITKVQAVNIIKSKFKKGIFIPNEVKNFKVDILRGIYVPYWLIDIEFQNSMVIRGKVKSGKQTVTRYFYRRVYSRFKTMPIDASRKFNDKSANRLEPFLFDEARTFEPQYLSGFYSDCSDEIEQDINYKAEVRTKEIVQREVFKDVPASALRVEREQPKKRILSRTYAMMPVWFMIFKYMGEPYTIMVNGQTGKMVGAVPFDKKRVVTCLFAFTAVISIFAKMVIDALVSVVEAEDVGDLMSFLFVISIMVLGFSHVAYKSYKHSVDLTRESRIKEFVSDRQEGM